MPRTYAFIVGQAEAGLRLDHYLVRHLPSLLSRSLIQRVIRQGQITVGPRLAKAHDRLRRGDQIKATFAFLSSPSKDVPLLAQPIALEIIYEDAHLVVVNKPAGLVTHPAPGHWSGTLVNAVLWHLQQGQGAADNRRGNTSPLSPRPVPLARAGIVHRLDKDTSGLLIVAKTETVHTALARQLKSRLIKRKYIAMVEGHVGLDRGTIDRAIGRHRIHRKEMTIQYLGGRQAVTHYRVLKRMAMTQETGCMPAKVRCTLLEVSLETGRTHQIRVHMAHLGNPILGDVTYGKRSSGFWQSLGITRQLLHAFAIHFQHPVTHQAIDLQAPLPEDIRQWIPPHAAFSFDSEVPS